MLLLTLVFTAVVTVLMVFPITLSPWLALGALALFGCWQRHILLRIFSAMVLAIATVSVHLCWLQQFELQSEDEQHDIVIVAQVRDMPERTQYGQRFHVELEQYDHAVLPFWQRPQILLSCYRDDCHVKAGERWRWTVKLKRPHGLVNFYGFDYEQYLFAHHVRATGSITEHAGNQKLEEGRGLQTWRQHLFSSLQHSGLEHASIIAGLSLGADDEIKHEIWDDLRRTGTTHLIAISGMHIVLIAVMAGAFFGWCWRLLRRPALWLATPYVQAIAGSVAAIAYAALAGFSVPTVRALLMTLLFAVVLLQRRQWSASTVLSAVAVIMLTIDPCVVLLPGFCLSFAAVAILLWLSKRQQNASWWRKAIQMQWWLSVGLMPLTLLMFSQLSLVSALVNLFAVPWVSFICTPLSLLGVALLSMAPDFAYWILFAADRSIDWFIWLNHFCAQWTWSVWQAPSLSVSVQLALLMTVLLLLSPAALRWRWLSPLAVLLCLLPWCYSTRPFAAITILDVGQGLALTIESDDRAAVYDAGSRSEKFDAGRDIVVPHLQSLGFSSLDSVTISHADNDHAGGAFALFSHYAQAQWRTGEALDHIDSIPCVQGQQWQMNAITFEVLSPIDTSLRRNDLSCVIRLRMADQTWLLTGDIEKKAEQRLLQAGISLKADVLLVPHHGSRTSSTPAFLATVQPSLAIISAGYKNRFGHPKPDVVARYQQSGTRLLNTADTGAIRFVWLSAGQPMQIHYARQTPRRWRRPPDGAISAAPL